MADATLNVKELIRIGKETGAPQVTSQGGIPYVVIPSDCKVVGLADMIYNKFSTAPIRKQAFVKVLDGASFIEYFAKFCDENSRVFADETQSRVLAVLDYHGAGDSGPRWCEHKLQLDLRHSDEWTTWTGKNGVEEKMVQVEFAEFIEDNTPDIVRPDAATMLEMARTLEAKTEADFSSAIRLNNGQVQFTYNENIKGTFGSGKVEIPEEFLIAIPVYVGGARVQVRARLRYRILGGKLSIWYDLLRVKEIERSAFMAILQEIKDGLKVSIINGNPA